MLNVMVVDDKKLIRRGVVSIIADSGLAVGRITECKNGKEALEVLQREPVDLVITDIRMPELDGIDLMKRARERNGSPRFIVLSGYDDFKYAQESMDYGARAYILKPLDKSELIRAIEKVSQEVAQEKINLEKEHEINAKERKLQEDELRLALLGSIHSDGFRDRLEHTAFPFNGCTFHVSLVIGGAASPFEAYALERLAGVYFTGRAAQYIALELDNATMVIAGEASHLFDFARSVRQMGGGSFTAVSDACHGAGKIREAYLQALEALKYRYLYPEREAMQYAEIAALRADYALPQSDVRKLCLLVGTEKLAAADALVSAIFDRQTIVQYKIGYLEDIAKALYDALNEIAGVLSCKWPEELKKYAVLGSVYNFSGMREYLACLIEFIHILDNYAASVRNAYHDNKEIDKAVSYIEQNFDKDINLAMVSNHVSMNYSYFSHVFKEKTGLSFVEYLRKIRVEKSIVMLCNGEMKISDIANLVGFDNYKNFTRTFRSVVGISPAEYRERLMVEKKLRDMEEKRNV